VKLKDGHIAWMRAYGVQSLDFDPAGNVLRVVMDAGIGANPGAKPEAPAPDAVEQPKKSDLARALAQSRKDREAMLFAASEGLPEDADGEA
jgi:hypothetical protein